MLTSWVPGCVVIRVDVIMGKYVLMCSKYTKKYLGTMRYLSTAHSQVLEDKKIICNVPVKYFGRFEIVSQKVLKNHWGNRREGPDIKVLNAEDEATRPPLRGDQSCTCRQSQEFPRSIA